MKDIWDASLNNKIDRFISRKAQEFPELELRRKWYGDTYSPKKRYFGELPKRAL